MYTTNIDNVASVSAVSGEIAHFSLVPFTAALMSWSVWYAVRYFRKSDEWGEAIRLLEAAQSETTETTTETPAVVTPAVAEII